MKLIIATALMLTATLPLESCAPSDTTDRRAFLTLRPPGAQTFAQLSASIDRDQKTVAIPQALESIQNTGPQVYARDYRWQVAIKVGYGPGWRCGGVLISPSYVLTAAHCLDGANAGDLNSIIRIGLGKIMVFHGGDKFGEGTALALDPTWPVTFHPKWKTTGVAYAWDAALLKLDKPVTGAVFAPAATRAFGEGDAVTSGWGDFDTTHGPSIYLRAVRLPVVSNDKCRGQLPLDQAGHVGAATLCAVSRTDDSCARDSGGPLVIGSDVLPQTIGIVSWGPSGACGVPNNKGVLVGGYTRVSEIAPWIKTATGDTTTVTDRSAGALMVIKPRNDI